MVAKQIKSNDFSLDGIYELLKDPKVNISDSYGYSHPIKTDNKTKNLSLGRIWFNNILPDDFRLVDAPVNKPLMDSIIKEILTKYGTEKASEYITTIQIHAFKMASIIPSSFSIDAFVPSEKFEAKKANFTKRASGLTDENFIKETRDLAEDYVKELNDKDIGIMDSMNSKTKGSTTDWQALVISRGHVVDLEDKISRVTPALNDGFSVEDYYKSAAQARRNYFIRSNLTAKPGYLARKLVMANSNIQITNEDCKTNKYLTITLDAKKAPIFIGRNYLSGSKLKVCTDASEIIGKEIKFRSPLYCSQPDGICQTCYGILNKKLDNTNVGIMAGTAVNNIAVNELMKLRHKATQVAFIDINFTKLTNQFGEDSKIITKILDIQEKEIYAKTNLTIVVNEKDYYEEFFSDLGDRFLIPGILEMVVGEGEDQVIYNLPYSFKVNLYKPENVSNSGSTHLLNYVKGEKILSQDKYLEETNMSVVDRLFEGQMKYIIDPKVLLLVISNELPKIDSVHLEVIVSNMFRSNGDPTVPGRLVNYKDCTIQGSKKTPFIDSWLTSLAFENVNKSIKVGLVGGKSATYSPIEKIVLEKHYNEALLT